MNHQTELDLDAECEGGAINSDDMKKFLKTNVDVVQAYIKQHLTKKPAAKKPAADKPKAAAKKTATSEAAK